MTVLRTLLDNSIAFSLLFAGVWLVKTALRRRLSPRMHYMIWAAVVACLLLPVRLESSLNLWSLLPGQATETLMHQAQMLTPLGDLASAADTTGGKAAAPRPSPAAAGSAPAQHSIILARTVPAKTAAVVDWPAVLLALWLSGMAGTGAWMLLASLRLRRHILRCASPATPRWVRDCARECAQALHLRRHVRIVIQPVLPTPAVMGVLHPVLALPESVLAEGDRERVRHILMHEFSHVRRGDLFAVAGMNLLSAVYWFHPLVWVCQRCIREDMETSCDNDVVQALGKNQRQQYIGTLVHYASCGGPARPLDALSLHDAKIQMKKRIGAMFMTTKTKPFIAAPVILLVLTLLLAASVTGCLPNTDKAVPVTNPTDAATAQTSAPAATTADATHTPEPSATPAATLQTASPAPTKTEATVPAASQWEDKYQPVLEQYREFAAKINQDEDDGDYSDMGDPWDLIAPDVLMGSKKFGYAMRDLDGNGIPELFLLTDESDIWAIYTLADDTPKLLNAFWARNYCTLDASDTLYIQWSNGAADSGWDACRISKDGKELTVVERVAMEGTDETGAPLDKPYYYKSAGPDSKKTILSEAEANKETAKFPQNNKSSGLTVIPLV